MAKYISRRGRMLDERAKFLPSGMPEWDRAFRATHTRPHLVGNLPELQNTNWNDTVRPILEDMRHRDRGRLHEMAIELRNKERADGLFE